MALRILITIPITTKGGGVSNYFRIIRDKFSIDVDYVVRGSRRDRSNWFAIAWRLAKDYGRFSRQLQREHYDLIHVNTSLGKFSTVRDAFYILIAKLFNKKVIVFFHGWDQTFADKMKGSMRSLFLFSYGRVDAMIVLATEFGELLNDWGIDRPFYLQTTPVDDEFVNKMESLNDSLARSEMDIPITILFLARLEREKGVYEAVEAFRILRERNHPVRLLIAGDGSELSTLKDTIGRETESEIAVLGYVSGDEKIAAFAQSDIYLFPTYYGEGMPTTVLEAMAAALTVVTRPVGGLKDFFEDGKMGFWTESKDPAVVAELIEPLLEDAELRRQMGHYNQSYARDRFLASQVARRLERIYREVILD